MFAKDQLPPGADREQYQVLVLQPSDGDTVQGVVHVIGRVQVPNFSHYIVEYGETHSPRLGDRLAFREPSKWRQACSLNGTRVS